MQCFPVRFCCFFLTPPGSKAPSRGSDESSHQSKYCSNWLQHMMQPRYDVSVNGTLEKHTWLCEVWEACCKKTRTSREFWFSLLVPVQSGELDGALVPHFDGQGW